MPANLLIMNTVFAGKPAPTSGFVPACSKCPETAFCFHLSTFPKKPSGAIRVQQRAKLLYQQPAEFRIALLQADPGDHGVVEQHGSAPLPEAFSGIRGQCGEVFVLIDEQYLVFARIKVAEKLFV